MLTDYAVTIREREAGGLPSCVMPSICRPMLPMHVMSPLSHLEKTRGLGEEEILN